MIEFVKVSLTRNKQTCLQDLNLEIQDHQVFGVFGSDQTSRSMLLKAAAGIEEPDKGRVLVNTENVYDPQSEAYKLSGFMQNHFGFYGQLTLEEYYEMILSLYKIYGRNRRSRLEEVLKMLDLMAFRETYLEEIPRSLFPMFGLGAAILHEPVWLILDEPFEMLDVDHREHMIDILKAMYQEGVSLIINTQVYTELTGFMTNLSVLEQGKVKICGSIEEVMEREMDTCPVRMHVIDHMEAAIQVLKDNPIVERVTVDGQEVIFRFQGDEREEAMLLAQITGSGALVRNYRRDSVNLEDILRR